MSDGLTRMGEVLLVTLPPLPTDQQALSLQQRALAAATSEELTLLLVDASKLRAVDPFLAQVLADLGASARILGLHPILAGVPAGVALVLSTLDPDLAVYETRRTVGSVLR